jgi:uncharacterized protein
MPEYLAPGVYVEETSFRAKSIEGVSTTTTGFVGPTRYGPLDIEPEIVTSLVEFERTYGGRERLLFDEGDGSSTEVDNFMWHAARAFFEEGGKRLYVSRVYSATDGEDGTGYASAPVGGSPALLHVRARFPGRAGDARVSFTFNVGQNVLIDEDPVAPGFQPGVRGLRNRDVVLIRDVGDDDASPPVQTTSRGFFVAHRDPLTRAWSFTAGEAGDSPSTPLADVPDAARPRSTEVRIVTVTVAVDPFAPGAEGYVETDLPLDPQHRRGDTPDSLFDAFARHARDPDDPDPNQKLIANLARARTVPVVIENSAGFSNGLEVLTAFFAEAPPPASPAAPTLADHLEAVSDRAAQRTLEVLLEGGDDGLRPQADAYEGAVDADTDLKTGLRQFEDLEDISIVAAPGSTFLYENAAYGPQARTIVRHLINHSQRMRYRIAVLDSGNDQTIARCARCARSSTPPTPRSTTRGCACWTRSRSGRSTCRPRGSSPASTPATTSTAPSTRRPANEVVNLALGFERFLLNKAQQEVLNPEGINCFRFFEGRGMRLWGARTISSDPEWKYVNLRRYFAYLERSIDKGTQWAVFEPNGERCGPTCAARSRTSCSTSGRTARCSATSRRRPTSSSCDRSTMTQNDLDNGRLVCLVGVAPLRPAEFVIFRIGQWTADRRV